MATKAKKDYSKSMIYKIEPICDHEEDEIYIGSTTKRLLCQRMAKHRCDYKRWKEGKSNFVSSFKLFDKYGVCNCKIILLESVCAKDINELALREAAHIKSLKCLNKMIPNRNTHQYYIDKMDKIKENVKNYKTNNYERIMKQMKESFKCDCGSEYTYANKQRHFKTDKHLSYIDKSQNIAV